MPFNSSRLAEAYMPEGLVAMGVAVGNLIFRALDAKAGRVDTLKRWNDYYHIGVITVSSIAVGYGKNVEIAKAAIVADIVPISDRLFTGVIQDAIGVALQPTAAAMVQFAPRTIVAPQRTQVAPQNIQRTYQPEFQQAGAF